MEVTVLDCPADSRVLAYRLTSRMYVIQSTYLPLKDRAYTPQYCRTNVHRRTAEHKNADWRSVYWRSTYRSRARQAFPKLAVDHAGEVAPRRSDKGPPLLNDRSSDGLLPTSYFLLPLNKSLKHCASASLTIAESYGD
jgi:hypothetical protein